MGQSKSKTLDVEHATVEGGIGTLSDESKAKTKRKAVVKRDSSLSKKKWRKKQGYSLPSGLDKPFGGSTLSLNREEDGDAAVLVSYRSDNRKPTGHQLPQRAQSMAVKSSSPSVIKSRLERTREALFRASVENVTLVDEWEYRKGPVVHDIQATAGKASPFVTSIHVSSAAHNELDHADSRARKSPLGEREQGDGYELIEEEEKGNEAAASLLRGKGEGRAASETPPVQQLAPNELKSEQRNLRPEERPTSGSDSCVGVVVTHSIDKGLLRSSADEASCCPPTEVISNKREDESETPTTSATTTKSVPAAATSVIQLHSDKSEDKSGCRFSAAQPVEDATLQLKISPVDEDESGSSITGPDEDEIIISECRESSKEPIFDFLPVDNAVASDNEEKGAKERSTFPRPKRSSSSSHDCSNLGLSQQSQNKGKADDGEEEELEFCEDADSTAANTSEVHCHSGEGSKETGQEHTGNTDIISNTGRLEPESPRKEEPSSCNSTTSSANSSLIERAFAFLEQEPPQRQDKYAVAAQNDERTMIMAVAHRDSGSSASESASNSSSSHYEDCQTLPDETEEEEEVKTTTYRDWDSLVESCIDMPDDDDEDEGEDDEIEKEKALFLPYGDTKSHPFVSKAFSAFAPVELGQGEQQRLPPLGCSSEDPVSTDDSLEEEEEPHSPHQTDARSHPCPASSSVMPKRSLPQVPQDASQQERARQLLRLHELAPEYEEPQLHVAPPPHDSLEDLRSKIASAKAEEPSLVRSHHLFQPSYNLCEDDEDLRYSPMRRMLPSVPNSGVILSDEKAVSESHSRRASLSPMSYRIEHDDSGFPSMDGMCSPHLSDQAEASAKNGPANFWVGLDPASREENLARNRKRSKVQERLSISSQHQLQKRESAVEIRRRQRHSAPNGPLIDLDSLRSMENAGSRAQAKRGSSVDRKIPLGSSSQPLNKKNIASISSRIHSAVISGINPETRSVTVEWFERGETKGKEIELEAILSLNQDLLPPDHGNIIPNKLSKSDRSALGQTRSYVPRPAGGGQQLPAPNGMRTRNKARQTIGNTQVPPINDMPSSNGTENIPPIRGATKEDPKAAVNRRRSNVVKEVERLKKNREERRAKQAEMITVKEAQKNLDPGNPNWEFLAMIQDYQDSIEFHPLTENDAVVNHQITVCVRKRPLNNKERKKREIDVVCCPNKDQIIVHEPKTKVDLTKYLDNQHFRFDYAFDEGATNELVYKYTAKPLVLNVFEGGMATCFAYGQTGSGKTHTMGGEFHGKQQDSKNGIYALAAKDVFKYLHSPKYKGQNLRVTCSYFEIYSGKVFDLLSGKSKLRVLEDGKQQVVVVGLTEKDVDCVEDVLKLINHGNNIRTSGQTSANAHSSRSHAVFQILLRQGADRGPKKAPLYGKFSLIDLAGNERGADTSSANRQTRMEGAEINKSLLALKECIRALGRKGGHLPFRASKLTQVLRDSFIGEKSKTCMIAMVAPVMSSCEHTLNTLRYADRVKELGAADPAKSSPSDGPEMRMDDGVMSPEDSDLAQLRSLNEGELSADWYNFQEAISHLQALEEELVESHKNVIDNLQHWVKEDSSLLAMTEEVDYDQDAYCQQLEDMVDEKIEALTALRAKAKNFRETLNDEEAKSRQFAMHQQGNH